MRWRSKLVALAWTVFVIWSVAWLQPRWFIETPLQLDTAFLPFAQSGFIAREADDERDSFFYLMYHYLCNPNHIEELKQVPGVEHVVLEELEPVPFPATRMVDHLIVDGDEIARLDNEDPQTREVLTRVLQDATRIEWRMLWERALIGTAIWFAAFVAMLGFTRRARRGDNEMEK